MLSINWIKRQNESNHYCMYAKCVCVLISQSVECPLRRTGGHGFDPGVRPNSFKMVLAVPRLALRLTG